MEQSYLGDFVTIWDLDLCIQEGRYDQALNKIARWESKKCLSPAHITSQFKHYEMLAYAHLGRFKEMDVAMLEAFRLRSKGGGPYFLHLTHCFAMGALSLAGRHRPAERIRNKCIKITDRTPLYHEPNIHAYWAANLLRLGKPEKARKSVQTLLDLLIRNELMHFFGWSPDIMKPVLSFAVKEGIHPAFAKELARNQMACDILDDGSIVPHLIIRSVGDLRLSLGDTSALDEWTPMERRIIELLALNPRHAMRIQDIQDELWPEQDLSATRAKFDTNLSRLRSKVSKIFGKGAGKRYLQTEGQRLRLVHCEIDCDKIIEFATKGIALANDGKTWMAHAALSCMAHLTGTEFEVQSTPLSLPEPLVDIVSKALLKWIEVLRSSLAPKEALVVAEKALSIDPINDMLQRERYNLLVSLKRPGEAMKGLKNYRLALEEHEFSDDEISCVIDNIFTSSD